MANRTDFVLPAMLGVMAAGRTQSVGAFVAWQGLDNGSAGLLGRGLVAFLAAGEVVADKTPWVPDRTQAGPLFGRTVFGAAGGAAVDRWEGGSGVRGALIGGVSAAAASFALNRARRWLVGHTPLPDFAWALAEDAAVAALGVAASRRLH